MSTEQSVRVIVVLDKIRGRVYSITADQDEAIRHTRELVAKYRGNTNAATMTAWTVDLPAATPQVAESEPTCGAVCPDITTITCTMPPDHPPVPVLVDGSAFPLAHFSKPYATAWNPGTALIHNATPAQVEP